MGDGKNPRSKKRPASPKPVLARKNERQFQEDVDSLIKKHKKVLDELAKE